MDAYDDEWADSDFEAEPDSETANTYKPSYLLIAIDTDKSMFENCKKTESYSFSDALGACYDIVNSLVLASQQSVKGPVSIVLANNDATKTNFVEFEQPIPDTIKFLKNLKKQPIEELQFDYERKGNFDLADFFLTCKNKLLNVKSEVYKRTVIYITNDDDPVGRDAKRRFKVINESQKFASIEMQLIVVTFNENFDDSNFYSEVLSASNSPPVEKVDYSNLTEKLSSLIQKRTLTRKCKFYPFPGNTESCVDVAVRRPVVPSTVSKNMYVTRDTREQLKKSVRQNSADTYTCIYSREESPIVLTEAERQLLDETKIPIGYTLFCVANQTLEPGWVIKSPYLMQKHAKETQELFEMFWQFCRDKNKRLICYQKLKKGGEIRFVELTPKLINNIRQFLVKILPFGPEIHYNPPTNDNKNTFSKEEENAMSNLIESLTFYYDTDVFQDPVESKKNAYIKSQLLEEDIEEIDDGIVSDDVIDERLADHVSKLESLGLLEAASSSTKRRRKTDYSKARKK